MSSLLTRVTTNFTKNSLWQTSKLLATFSALKKCLDNTPQTFKQNYSTDEKKKQNLLRFPAIPLKETIPKFIKTIEPLLNEEEMKETQDAIRTFMRCSGPQLQKLLEDRAACEENWLADRWLRVTYMQYRDPLPVHSNPGMPFPLQKFTNDDEYICYASKLVVGMVKFKEMIDSGKMPIEKMGKLELDNSQYGLVYGTCRIPGKCEDTLQYNPNSVHAVVIYKNHFYKLPLYDKNCKPLHIAIIADQLKKILDTEKVKGPEFGVLTTDQRDNWAVAYRDLLRVPGNQELINEIQASMFTISLDEPVPIKVGTNSRILAAVQTIHGGGSKENGCNRWMDKTIQVLVNPNGVSGLCYEHSPAEGQPVAQMINYTLSNLETKNFFDQGSTKDYEPAKKLELKSSDAVDEHINTAKENLDKEVCNLHMTVLHYTRFGKAFLKKQKMSPDSFIQMAFQYAFYMVHKVPGACYESAHLRIYYNGRTETIRSCSSESLAFAKAMCDPECTDDMRADLMRKAVKSHRDYAIMALQGRGVDRHLLGLKLMAIENNREIPKLYISPGYLKSSHFRLSTSQVASPYEAHMCFGPSCEDGYAICYNPREYDIFCACSSYYSNSETDADCLKDALSEAFDKMYETLENVC